MRRSFAEFVFAMSALPVRRMRDARRNAGVVVREVLAGDRGGVLNETAISWRLPVDETPGTRYMTGRPAPGRKQHDA